MRPLLFSIMLIVASSIFSQNSNEQLSDSIFDSAIDVIEDTISYLDIFASEEIMHLSLEYDITTFIQEKGTSEYLDASLVIHYLDFIKEKQIRLKSRGNFRKNQCYFPPIYLNFKTDPIGNIHLEGIRKIKMVTHCNTSKTYSSYILKEYLVYKLYNQLTDFSFRVKLVDINYKDTGKKGRNYEQFGFLIEPLESLTKRTESRVIDPRLVRGVNVIPEQADIVALFQYMIGNTDWLFKEGHNMKYVKSAHFFSEKVTPVPYDFDFSGFVNTHYSFPQEWTSIETVKEREYLGYCREDEPNYQATIDLFISKKAAMYSVVSNFNYLSSKERKYLIRYLDDFFYELEYPKHLISDLEKHCRGLNF